jgi:hypothetical protein
MFSLFQEANLAATNLMAGLPAGRIAHFWLCEVQINQ